MKRRIYLTLLLFSLGLLLPAASTADAFDAAVGLKAGTPGVGVELTMGLIPRVNLRAGLNGFQYGYEAEINDLDYDFDLNLLNVPLLVDWHLFDGGFRISGGIVLNGNEIDLTSTPDKELVIINDRAYRSDEVGTISGTIDFNQVAPYLGIGWGNAVGENKRLGIGLDLGIMFQGGPKASLSASGPLASDPQFQEDLDAEAGAIEDDTDSYNFYPVIALAITLRFN